MEDAKTSSSDVTAMIQRLRLTSLTAYCRSVGVTRVCED